MLCGGTWPGAYRTHTITRLFGSMACSTMQKMMMIV
jgi:hypothetical protein